MTDDTHTLDWEASSDKYTDKIAADKPLSTVLYDGFHCHDCGEAVDLYEFDPDPDDPSWYGECPRCETHYNASPASVTITSSTDP